MLVLTRKTQQQIQIGPHITITILEVKGHSVRVGIVAPRDVNVFRSELAVRIAQEKENSSGAPAGKKSAPQPASQLQSTLPQSALPQSTGRQSTGPQATTSQSVETAVADNPSVRCRAPRVAAAPQMKHPVRTGPASLGTHRASPLDSRLQSVLAR